MSANLSAADHALLRTMSDDLGLRAAAVTYFRSGQADRERLEEAMHHNIVRYLTRHRKEQGWAHEVGDTLIADLQLKCERWLNQVAG